MPAKYHLLPDNQSNFLQFHGRPELFFRNFCAFLLDSELHLIIVTVVICDTNVRKFCPTRYKRFADVCWQMMHCRRIELR